MLKIDFNIAVNDDDDELHHLPGGDCWRNVITKE